MRGLKDFEAGGLVVVKTVTMAGYVISLGDSTRRQTV